MWIYNNILVNDFNCLTLGRICTKLKSNLNSKYMNLYINKIINTKVIKLRYSIKIKLNIYNFKFQWNT